MNHANAAPVIGFFNSLLEVTETAVIADVAKTIDILTRAKMKGFGLSIDDFGTGFSSMEQLVRIPFNELKIDQRFVRNLETSNECAAVAEVSIALAHKLQMTVVGEGIETEAIETRLRDMGCDDGQGFGFARPMPIEEFGPWMVDHGGTGREA